jgi:two-component system cell cycle sensor histidine kinase/response regulator CckA
LASAVEAPGRRHRVLVVDDEEAVGEGLRMLLEQEYSVELAPGGRKALEMLSREAFDVVLCDLMMPGMSGIELFHAVKATHPGLERKIVFMTGGAFTPEAETFLDEVVNGRVEKPFDFANVDRLLRYVLANTASH